MKHFLLVLVLFFAALLGIQAQCVINNTGSSSSLNSTHWQQSFKASCSGYLQSVSVSVVDQTFTSFQVFSGSGCSNLLTTQTINCSAGICTVTLTSSIPVLQNAVYTFRFQSSSFFATLSYNNSDNYTGGTMFVNSNCTIQNADLNFSVAISNTPPLPIGLAEFNANNEHGHVQLGWRTVSESNNKGFDIQHSTDDKNWNDLAFIPGYGTTQEQQSYIYTDEHPQFGLNYYRLRQVDYDGPFTYSNIVSVEIKNGGSGIHFFPNPATDNATLALETDFSGEATLTLYDLTGTQIKTERLSLEGGASLTDIRLDDLRAGIYMVQVQAGEVQWRERFIIK